jgi:hypothetical protein
MWTRITFVALVALAAGCGSGTSFAPVSGRVTLNGAPLANATVSFQPLAPDGSRNAAPGSTGTTNENGEYKLVGPKGENGAWIGKHRVVITPAVEGGDSDARRPAPNPAKEKGSAKSNNPKEKAPEKGPVRYNNPQDTFTVPPDGTTSADFALTSP